MPCRPPARPPFLASPSILFFLSRPASSHHHAALFSKNPVLPLLLRPFHCCSCFIFFSLPPSCSSYKSPSPSLILASSCFRSFLIQFVQCSPSPCTCLYICCVGASCMHKWRTPHGLAVSATTVISILFSFLIYGCSCRYQYPVSVSLLYILLCFGMCRIKLPSTLSLSLSEQISYLLVSCR